MGAEKGDPFFFGSISHDPICVCMGSWLREISTFDAKRSVGRCVYVAFPLSACRPLRKKKKGASMVQICRINPSMMMTITPLDVPLDPWLGP